MKHPLALFIAIACLYNSQCPEGVECVVDASGAGVCRVARAGEETITTGQTNRRCSFPSDCADNEVCARPRGYLDFGVCRRGVRGE